MSNIPSPSQPILVVDDSEDDYEAIVRAFKKVGLNCPIAWCRSGQDALDGLKRACAEERATTRRGWFCSI